MANHYNHDIGYLFAAQRPDSIKSMLQNSCWACRANPTSARCICDSAPAVAAEPVATPDDKNVVWTPTKWTPTKPSSDYTDDEVREAPDFAMIRDLLPDMVPDYQAILLARQAIRARAVNVGLEKILEDI